MIEYDYALNYLNNLVDRTFLQLIRVGIEMFLRALANICGLSGKALKSHRPPAKPEA